MVGPLTIWKMLHCRNIYSAKTSTCPETVQKERNGRKSTTNEIVNSFNANDERANNELCRVCLREGLIPIFAVNTSEDIAGALNTIGGIEVNIDDSYPKYLCQPCHALLLGAILFRKTAQQSDRKLKKQMEESELKTYDHRDFAGDNDNESLYKSHKKSKPNKFLTCKRCNIQFNSCQEYSEHILTEEHENKKVPCPICKNVYVPEYLKKHMTCHKPEALYVCDVCGKKFTHQSQFSRHRMIHFYSLPFKCSLCPYKGRFRESLKMHMRSHTGEKPYQCEKCPRRFINKSNLNKHALTHKEQHDFRCEVCGRGFYTKRDLEMHLKAVHSGIMEHVCPICNKAFGYRKQMMKHQLKVHKREKLKSGRTPLYIQVERMKQQENNLDVHEIQRDPTADISE